MSRDEDDAFREPPDLQGYTLATRKTVMYPDLNAAGRLFGGQLMSWIDESSAMVAARVMRAKRVVTKKVGELVFDAPGMLGDIVEVWCRPLREGRTSLALECRVLVYRSSLEPIPICRCEIVYVNLDESGRPAPWRG